MNITYYNDGKGKWQSYEIKGDTFQSDGDGNLNIFIEAYGENEESTKEEFRRQITLCIKTLQEIEL